MRLLFVAPYAPSHLRVRPYAFIRQLARLGHEITLACLVQPAAEYVFLAEAAPYCRAIYPVFLGRYQPYLRCLGSLPARVPLSVAYCRSAAFERLVRDLAGRPGYDLIHTEFVRATPATLRLAGPAKVYDAVDSLALAQRRNLSAALIPPFRRLIALLEWLKLRRYERWVAGHYAAVLVSSPVDGRELSAGGRQVTVIPNGVDLDYFAFQDGPRSGEEILFLGRMNYLPNVASLLWFYRRVLPQVRRQHPGVKLKVVGRDPVRAITALAADPAVEITGAVPDVRPYLAGATLSVCPMVSGAGLQNKLLEAMAVGAPCVATALAGQALQARAGQDYLLANHERDFAAAVLELLENPARRRQLVENARRYVEQEHNWEQIGQRLEHLYCTLPALPSFRPSDNSTS